MKTTRHAIKAFTLTEIMVVLGLASIVAGIAFSVLNLVQKNSHSIANNYALHTEIQSLEVALTIDFNRYTQVAWNSNQGTLIASSPLGKEQYQFYTDSIVTSIHTYAVITKNKLFYYQGNRVTSGAVDAIEITFEHTSDIHRTFVYRYTDPLVHFEKKQ